MLLLIGLSTLAGWLDHGSLSHDYSTGAGEDSSKCFLPQVVQPGLSGLMDGADSTLAPIFTMAFVTGAPFKAFLVGMASATGVGISMAFSEALWLSLRPSATMARSLGVANHGCAAALLA